MNLANMITVFRPTSMQKDGSVSGRASDLRGSMKDKTEEADERFNRRIKESAKESEGDRLDWIRPVALNG
jgi:hypothetical protein